LEIYPFGSPAKGEAAPESDIDLLIIYSDISEAVVRLPRIAAFSGRTITVPILVENRSDASAADIKLSYDPDALTILDVTAGAPGSLIATNTTNPGEITAALINVDGVVGPDGSILVLRLKVKEVTAKGMSVDDISLFDRKASPIRVRSLPLPTLALTDIYTLSQNFPNPFNAETVIQYRLAKNSRVMLKVYNMSGQVVRRLVDSELDAGRWSTVWDGKDDLGQEVSSGVYLCRLVVDGGQWTRTMKMILLR